jgi:hypothetical protein
MSYTACSSPIPERSGHKLPLDPTPRSHPGGPQTNEKRPLAGPLFQTSYRLVSADSQLLWFPGLESCEAVGRSHTSGADNNTRT